MSQVPAAALPSRPTGGVPVALLLLVAGGLLGWTAHRLLAWPAAEDDAGKAEAAEPARVRVTTAPIVHGAFAAGEPFVGVVTAEPGAVRTISGRAGGIVVDVPARAGTAVTAGARLVVFDQAPLQAAVQAAHGGFAAARYQHDEFERVGSARTDSDLAAAEERTGKELRLAEEQFQRLLQLHQVGGIADRTYAEAGLAVDKERLDHEQAARAVTAWRQHGAGLQAANLVAAEDAAKAALAQAEAALADAVLCAPADGTVLGVIPRIGDRCEAGAPLGTLLVGGGRRVTFTVPPVLAARLDAAMQAGKPVAVDVVDAAGEHAAGRLASVGLEAGNDGLVEFSAVLTAPTPALLLGTVVRGEVVLEAMADATIVPVAAVLRLGDQTHVLVRRPDGHGQRVPVQVRGRSGGTVAVVGEIPTDATVVVAGGYNVPDGAVLVEGGGEPGAAQPDHDPEAKK